jgi:ABC-type sulfate/molybdate transport systems ATPase subunit
MGTMLERLRLSPLRSRRPGQMSGGERQRLAIARAMVAGPPWLLLDEPLAHLDGPAREELLGLLGGALADSQAGVLMTSHNPEETLRLAHEVVILAEGAALQTGPAMEVYHRPASLAAAVALGPAAEVRGEARQGNLLADGVAAIESIDPNLTGAIALILRPEHLEFLPASPAPTTVRRCQWSGGRYRLAIETPLGTVPVYSPAAIAEGTPGRLRYLPPPPCA